MISELILICVLVVVAIVALLSSKFVRAVCREAIFRPRNRCEIQPDSPSLPFINLVACDGDEYHRRATG